MENVQPTNQELLQAIQHLSTHMDEEIHGVKEEIHEVKTDLQDVKDAMQIFSTNVDEKFAQVDGQLSDIGGRLTRVESTMVTKDYLDTKLADLRGDLTTLVRKEDRKVLALVDELREQNTISEEGAKRIALMEPFPQLG